MFLFSEVGELLSVHRPAVWSSWPTFFFAWNFFFQVYSILPRPYKKNIKSLFMVHTSPTGKFFLKVILFMVSRKFWRKVSGVFWVAISDHKITSGSTLNSSLGPLLELCRTISRRASDWRIRFHSEVCTGSRTTKREKIGKSSWWSCKESDCTHASTNSIPGSTRGTGVFCFQKVLSDIAHKPHSFVIIFVLHSSLFIHSLQEQFLDNHCKRCRLTSTEFLISS